MWKNKTISLLSPQACGWCVEVVQSCWTEHFFVKDSGQIFCDCPSDVTYMDILEYLVSERLSAPLTERNSNFSVEMESAYMK